MNGRPTTTGDDLHRALRRLEAQHEGWFTGLHTPTPERPSRFLWAQVPGEVAVYALTADDLAHKITCARTHLNL